MKRVIALGAVTAALVLALAGCGARAARQHDAVTRGGQPAAATTTTKPVTGTTAPAGPATDVSGDLTSIDKALTGIDTSLGSIDENITDADKAADNDQ